MNYYSCEYPFLILLDSKDEILNSLDEIIFTLILKDTEKYRDIVERIENRELTSFKEVKRLITD